MPVLTGKELLAEKQQAEADKEVEEESEVAAVSAELKPGERKIISDGTRGTCGGNHQAVNTGSTTFGCCRRSRSDEY